MKLTKIAFSIFIVILMMVGSVTPVLAEGFISETSSQVCDREGCYTFSLSDQEVKEINEAENFKFGFITILKAFFVLIIYLFCLRMFYDVFTYFCSFSNGASIFCSIIASGMISYVLGIILI